MSLLDRGKEDVIVYLEERYTDSDGNTMVRAASTGVPAKATIQLKAQSGTSARRAEQDNEGFETESVYRLRFARSFRHTVGAQAKVEWNGIVYSVIGDAQPFNGSRRTRHLDFTIRRT